MPAVNDAVWTAEGTNPAEIEQALRELLVARRLENDNYVPARVLNLVCIVDRQWSGEVANRLRRVGRSHASRTIVCAISPGRRTLDAVATVAADAEPGPQEPALTTETVIIDLGPSHVEHLDTILAPLVVTDLPSLVWAPHGHWAAVEAVRDLVQIVLLDSADEPDVEVALRRASTLLETHRVVDLAWLRSTPWRERLATHFDPPSRRSALRMISAVEVCHHPISGSSALLMCGWLAARLGWPPAPLTLDGRGHANGHFDGVKVELTAVELPVPGLDSVTLTLEDARTLTLRRGSGGLHARERDAAGQERSWTLLGASRGEGGILGDGIRQSLLHDPIYRESLAAAEAMLASAHLDWDQQ